MPPHPAPALLLPLLLLLPACHPRFREIAPTLGQVRVQAVVAVQPWVALGRVAPPSDPNYVSAAGVATDVVNVVQGVRETDETRRIEKAVDLTAVNEALVAGFAEALGNGPPFAWSPVGDSGPLLEIELSRWGLMVPYLGAPGEFTYEIRTRIYSEDGERVYSSSTTCTTGVAEPGALEVMLGIVDEVARLDQATDAQITDVFARIARWCGQEVVRKIREDAG